MFKKGLVVILAICCANVLASDIDYFTGAGDGTDWADDDNWSLTYQPYYNTDSSLNTYIGMNATADINVVVDSMTEAGRMWLGRPEDPSSWTYRLSLETSSADLYVYRIYIGPYGIMDINDGIFSTNLASFASGTVNLNAGELELRSTGWTVGGRINISGGTFTVNGALTSGNILTAGKINLCGGQLVAEGDGRAVVNGWISSGNRILAYNGDSNYMVQATYDEIADETTVMAAPYSVALNKWTGAGDGYDWADANNWSLGTVPTYNVNNSEYTYIGYDATGDCNVFVYDDARSGKAWIGRPEDPNSSYILNLQGADAFYYLVRMYAGPKAVINVNGGEFDTWECRFDGAEVNLNSGLLTVRSAYWFFFGGAVINVNGGTLRIKNGTVFSTSGSGADHNYYFTSGTMNFCGGKLVMDGDCIDELTWHINNGNILVSGNIPQADDIDLSYDETTNLTVLKARNDVRAINTWPKDTMSLTVDARRTFQLNWRAGKDANDLVGYNVYVDGPNDSDLVLVSSSTEPCTDTSWQITSVPLGATYRWRVDEITDGGSSIIPGEIWSVKIASSQLSVYQRLYDGVMTTLNYQWIGCGDGSSWDDEFNWHTEFTDPNLAIPTYTGHEGDILESRINNSVMNVDWYSSGGNFFVGYGLSQTVNLVNGYWQLYRLYCYTGGTINIDSSSTAKWILLALNGGTVNLEGYLDIVSQHWAVKQVVNGQGGIKILDGQMLIETMNPSSPFDVNETGNIDIYEGRLIVNGNYISTVQSWIDDDHIVAYGGTDANSIVDLYYDSDANQTIVTARQDRRLAYAPAPANNEDNFDASADISWTVGTGVDSDTLYMTKALTADLNGDGTVDVADLGILMDCYLDNSWQSVQQADIAADEQINMYDFAELASQWQDTFTLTEIATFNRGGFGDIISSYSASLDYDTKYYWRIDSNDGGNIIEGELWSFTTASDPMAAYGLWPVSGDENIVADSNSKITLSWDSNSLIDNCNVYFTDSYGEVFAATVSDSAYQSNTSSGQWETPVLTTGKTYYWRIDTVDGASVVKGRVCSFTTCASPEGLYVQSGTLKHAGTSFKGYGVNYIDPFVLELQGLENDYQRSFEVLSQKGIPFIRMWGSSRYVKDWKLYFEDKQQYFSLMDDVMASAQENNVGVVFSMFWSFYLLPDVVGEHVASWGDSQSDTSKFMEEYIREIYNRYKNCPAFWGWELGNEYNLAGEQNALAPVILEVYGHPQTRDSSLDRLNMTLVRQIATNFADAVHKVDKNRIVSNGFSIRLDATTGTYGLPERYEDHQMADVASIHYYAKGGATESSLADAVSTSASWGKPLFVGEFGVSEANINGFPTVQDGFADMLDELENSGVIFAAMWIYEFDEHDYAFESASNTPRSYMLDMLTEANNSLNP